MEAIIFDLRNNVQQNDNGVIMMQQCLSRVDHLNKTQQQHIHAPRMTVQPTNTHIQHPIQQNIGFHTISKQQQPTSDRILRDLRKKSEEEAIMRMRQQLQYNQEQERKKAEAAMQANMQNQLAQDFQKGILDDERLTTSYHYE
jgi:predicted nucleic acid-binding protein